MAVVVSPGVVVRQAQKSVAADLGRLRRCLEA
jgi:hypothetical protein